METAVTITKPEDETINIACPSDEISYFQNIETRDQTCFETRDDMTSADIGSVNKQVKRIYSSPIRTT